MNEHMTRMETAEMRFLRAAAGCSMADQKRNEVMREEMGVKYMNTINVKIK
jgi:hypothetical protein